MNSKYAVSVSTSAAVGFFLSLIGKMIMHAGGFIGLCGLLIFLSGWVLIALSCALYASAKGYSPMLGLLGSLHLVGLIIILLLPARRAY